MKFSRCSTVSLISGAIPFLAFARAASAETVVEVALCDKGEASTDGMDTMMPMGMAMLGARMDMATMGIIVHTQRIPQGR